MTDAVPPLSTQALFVDSWQVYRKMVDHDYLFHRGAYDTLREVLDRRISHPFVFLDIACGDASMSVKALAGLPVEAYHGIDISEQALELARLNAKALACPSVFQCIDFATAIPDWQVPVDVAWIGLSSHHLRYDGKLQVMTALRRIVGEDGILLVYEDASPDGETRQGWLRRWDAQKPAWTAYDEAEWTYVTDHVHSSDFPETDRDWRELGHGAGFTRIEEHYRSPSDLFRLYSFSA